MKNILEYFSKRSDKLWTPRLSGYNNACILSALLLKTQEKLSLKLMEYTKLMIEINDEKIIQTSKTNSSKNFLNYTKGSKWLIEADIITDKVRKQYVDRLKMQYK